MSKYILFFIPFFFVVSCSDKPDTTTLEGKKQYLAIKNKELISLQKEIDELKAAILKEEPKREKAPVAVNSLNIEKSNFTRFVELQGVVSTDAVANASSEMGGRIVRLYVKEGQNVSKGQLIASTDAESIDSQKAEIQKALDLAVDVYERQKRLWEQNIGSEVQYLQAKNNKERLEKSIQSINVQSRKRNIYAPISGTIERVVTKEGELAGPGVPIVSIINTRALKVVSDVPEAYLGKVKVGDNVLVKFPALNAEAALKVNLLGTSVDPSNRTFKMEMNINKTIANLKPNVLSVMMIKDLEIKDVIVLPVDVIQQEVSGKKYVYLIEKSSENKVIARKRYVTTGDSADNKIVITEGLSGGEVIVTDGARNITEDQPLILQ